MNVNERHNMEEEDSSFSEFSSSSGASPRSPSEILMEDAHNFPMDRQIECEREGGCGEEERTQPPTPPESGERERIGEVLHIFEESKSCTVSHNVGGGVLDLDNKLIFNMGEMGGESWGIVEDVLGPITHPIYWVRIIEGMNNICIGGEVVVVSRSKRVVMEGVITNRVKGCDASNEHDGELNAEELEFSDDEKERVAKSHRRKSMYNPHESRKCRKMVSMGEGGEGGSIEHSVVHTHIYSAPVAYNNNIYPPPQPPQTYPYNNATSYPFTPGISIPPPLPTHMGGASWLLPYPPNNIPSSFFLPPTQPPINNPGPYPSSGYVPGYPPGYASAFQPPPPAF